MKRPIVFLLALLCVFSLAACGGKTDMAVIDLDHSTVYSEQELLAAVDVVSAEGI